MSDDTELPENPDFERWCFTAMDDRNLIDGKPGPVLTTVMYRVCNAETRKFNEALRALQLAFEAGQKCDPSNRGT